MFGREGEQLEKLRIQRSQQYAADLQQQIESQNQSTFRRTAANQILNTNNSITSPRRSSDQYNVRYLPQVPPREQYPINQNTNYPTPSYDFNSDSFEQKVKFMIDRALATEIPLKTKRYDEMINSMSSKVDSVVSSNQNSLSTIREKINEITLTMNSINQKTADNNERIAHDINTLKQDTQKGIESINSRLSNLESTISQFSEVLSNITQRHHQFESLIGEQILQLSATINATLKISSDRDQQIMQQVEGLNRQAITTFTQMGQQIQSVSDTVNTSITSLAMETKNGIELLRMETDQMISNIEKEAEANNQAFSESLKSLQNEIVSTVDACATFTKNSNQSAQNAIIAEHENRVQNERKMFDSYNAFTVAIAEQINQHNRTIEKLEVNQRRNVEQQCANYLSTWKSDLGRFLTDVSATVGSCQTRTAAVEKKLAEYVVSVGKRQDEILELIARNRNEPVSGDTKILNERIAYLEQQLHKDNNGRPAEYSNTESKKPVAHSNIKEDTPQIQNHPPEVTSYRQPPQPYRPPMVDPKLKIRADSATNEQNGKQLIELAEDNSVNESNDIPKPNSVSFAPQPTNSYQQPTALPNKPEQNRVHSVQNPQQTAPIQNQQPTPVKPMQTKPSQNRIQPPPKPIQSQPSQNQIPNQQLQNPAPNDQTPIISGTTGRPNVVQFAPEPQPMLFTGDIPEESSEICPKSKSTNTNQPPIDVPINPEDQVISMKNPDDAVWPEEPIDNNRRKPRRTKKLNPDNQNQAKRQPSPPNEQIANDQYPPQGFHEKPKNAPRNANRKAAKKKRQEKQPTDGVPAQPEKEDNMDIFTEENSLSEFSMFKETDEGKPGKKRATKK